MKKQLLLLVVILLPLAVSAYDFEVDGYRYTIITSTTAEFAGVNPEYEGEVIIPEYVSYSGKQLSVNTIGESAFENYQSSFLRIPQHITLIKNSAFYKAKIDSLHFDNSDNSISLQNTINRSPSMSNSKLGSVYIGRQINRTDFNSNANGPFYWSSVKKVYIGKTCNLAAELFQSCSSLEQVIVKEDSYIESINSECFRNCSQLNKIDLKKGLTSISSQAFGGCVSLDSIYIPSTVTSIKSNAFSEATNIQKVVSASEDPVAISETAFPGIVYLSSTLYVPIGSKAKYETTVGWKEFANIVEILEGGDTPEPQKCEKPTISYNNGQLKFASATEGAKFISEITDSDIKKNDEATVTLTATYNISVYATKSGYENSETANATLCWIDQQPKVEGDINGIVNVPAKALLIKNNGGQLTVEGAADGEAISVYTVNGMESGSAISQNGAASINTNLQTGSIAIVKIGDKSVKVVIK